MTRGAKIVAGIGAAAMGGMMLAAGTMMLSGPCDLPRFPNSKVGMMCELPRHGYYFLSKQQFLDELDPRTVDKSLATPNCEDGYLNAPCLRVLDGQETMAVICLKQVSGMSMLDPSCEFDKRRRLLRQ